MELFVKKDDMVIYVTEAIGKLRDEILILLKRIDDALNLKAD